MEGVLKVGFSQEPAKPEILRPHRCALTSPLGDSDATRV